VFGLFYRRAYNSQRARSLKKKFKAFSAPPFVLKAVMAGQVGKSHLLGLFPICSVQAGLRDWSTGIRRLEIKFFSSLGLQTLACKMAANHTAMVLIKYSRKGKKCACLLSLCPLL